MRVIRMSKKILIIVSIMLIAMLGGFKVFATNYTLEVNFDGKSIEMVSPTPEMIWEVKKIQPGEEQYNIITVSNKGTRNVDVEFFVSAVNEENLANILDIKIIKLVNDNPNLDEIAFCGKCAKMEKVNFSLDVGKNQSYKIVVCLPKEMGNEYKGKACKLKFNFTSSGVSEIENVANTSSGESELSETEDISDTSDTEATVEVTATPEDVEVSENSETTQTVEQDVKRISTSTIKPQETGESRWAFVVITVLIVIFVILLFSFLLIKKGK